MVRAGRGVTAGEGSHLKAVSESQVNVVTMLSPSSVDKMA